MVIHVGWFGGYQVHPGIVYGLYKPSIFMGVLLLSHIIQPKHIIHTHMDIDTVYTIILIITGIYIKNGDVHGKIKKIQTTYINRSMTISGT